MTFKTLIVFFFSTSVHSASINLASDVVKMSGKELVWILLLLNIEEYLMESDDISKHSPTAFKKGLSSKVNLAILCPRPKDTGMKNFRLYSSTKISEFDGFDDDVIQKTTFSDKKLAVIAHGYTENGNATWMKDMANALVGLENMNAITVNWGDLSTGRYDCVVKKNMPRAVKRVVNLLEKIVDKKHQKTDDIHLIGFSLGAHLMGRTGKTMKDAKKEVGRITGLDPAGPLFKRAKVSKRLDASHAFFVDAIHTDTRLLRLEKVLGLPVHFTVFATGTNMRMAKSDFYPNDGYHQPGCKSITFDLLANSTLTREQLTEIVVCNHIRSVLLFIESIKNKNAFPTKRCEDNRIFAKESKKTGDKKCIEPANQMGYFTDLLEEGVFYVKTNGEPPYAIEPRRRKKKTKKTRRA